MRDSLGAQVLRLDDGDELDAELLQATLGGLDGLWLGEVPGEDEHFPIRDAHLLYLGDSGLLEDLARLIEDPEALGALTGAFFFGFSAMQLPCGLFFDRYGPRLTVFGMLVLAASTAKRLTPPVSGNSWRSWSLVKRRKISIPPCICEAAFSLEIFAS